jgi:7-cyano-7-deazaguanine synthase
MTLGLSHSLEIAAPYAHAGKAEVIRRGAQAGVRLELTLSCMNPLRNGGDFPRHCGVCSKCRERHDAFVEAAMTDATDYADRSFTG